MDCGINAHRDPVSVLTGDLFVNFKQIAVALANRFFAEAFDGVGKIEINAATTRTDAATFVANFLPVAAGGQHDCVGRDVVDLTSAQIAGNNSLGVSIDDDDVEHFGLGKHLNGAGGDLAAERLITAKQKLLPSLTARIKRSRNLRAAEAA